MLTKNDNNVVRVTKKSSRQFQYQEFFALTVEKKHFIIFSKSFSLSLFFLASKKVI